MINIMFLLSSIGLDLSTQELSQFSKIVKGIYSISTGGITQKNISRQTNSEGLGYRSIQRFFAKKINWSLLYLSCVQYFF